MTEKQEKITLLRQKAEALLLESDSSDRSSIDEHQAITHELQVHQIELQMQNDELLLIQDALEKSKQRYLNLYNKAPVGYFEINYDLSIQEVNATALKLLDGKHSDIIKKSITDFIFIDDQDIFYLFRKKLLNVDETHSCEIRMQKFDGRTFWAHIEANIDQDDSLNALFRVVIHDISDRKRYESDLKAKDEIMLLQSRQAAMGEMVAMIAHQWRQPLSILSAIVTKTQLEVSIGETPTSEDLMNYAAESEVQIKYLSETINDFKDFLKPNLKKENILISDVMKITLNMIRKTLEENKVTIKINFNSTHHLDIVKNQLNQVFINLIENAKDALLEQKVDNPIISINIDEDEDFIIIKISDNGNGIPLDVLPHLGEPYISSKALHGTGLGVYMSKKIIEKHMNGILKWENLDIGACFTVMLRKK
jgi:PAS domain S-box-containing protein